MPIVDTNIDVAAAIVDTNIDVEAAIVETNVNVAAAVFLALAVHLMVAAVHVNLVQGKTLISNVDVAAAIVETNVDVEAAIVETNVDVAAAVFLALAVHLVVAAVHMNLVQGKILISLVLQWLQFNTLLMANGFETKNLFALYVALKCCGCHAILKENTVSIFLLHKSWQQRACVAKMA